MMYELRYKCFLAGWCKRFVDGAPKGVPIIRVEYRKEGEKRWAKGIEAAIDWYASEFWKEYYRISVTDMPLDERMYTIKEILDDRYHGDLINYVRAMVEYEVMNEHADRTSKAECSTLVTSFVTDGWKTGKVEVAEWR